MMMGSALIMILLVMVFPFARLLAGFNGASWKEDYKPYEKFLRPYIWGCCHNSGIYLCNEEFVSGYCGGGRVYSSISLIARLAVGEPLLGVCIVWFS